MGKKRNFRRFWTILLPVAFLLVGGEGFLHPLMHAGSSSACRESSETLLNVRDAAGVHTSADAISGMCMACAGVLLPAMLPQAGVMPEFSTLETGCDSPAGLHVRDAAWFASARAPPCA